MSHSRVMQKLRDKERDKNIRVMQYDSAVMTHNAHLVTKKRYLKKKKVIR
jgi:hypothetical protein